MRKAGMVCALIGVSACFLLGGPEAVAVLIDFEDAPGDNVPIGGYYSGLTFGSDDLFVEWSQHNTSYAINGEWGAFSSNDSRIAATWDEEVCSVAALVKGNDVTLTMEARSGPNGTGYLLDYESVYAPDLNSVHSLSVAAQGIRSVVVHDSQNFWVLDDLTYQYCDRDIPEPSTLALLALGGVAAFFRRR